MVDVYIPEQKYDKNLNDQYFDFAKAGTLDVLGSTLDETLYYNPLNALGRLADQKLGKGREGGMLTKDEWASSEYFREDIEVGDEGIKEGLASLLANRHDERSAFGTTLSRSRGGLGLGAAQFGVAIAGSFLDPLNVASAFIPSVAVARSATMAARFGKRGNRFMTGVVDGAIGAAVIEPLVISAAVAEQDRDYGLMDSFLNVAVGSALGGGLHWGVGKISDRINRLPPETRDQAQRISLGQAAMDEDINVTSLTDDVERVNIAKGEEQSGKKIVYNSEGVPRAVDIVNIDKDGTITIRDVDGKEKVLDASDVRGKSPFDEDYEVEDIGTGEIVPLSTISDEFLNATVKEFNARIDNLQPYAGKPKSEIESDAIKIDKLKADKKAVEIELDRRAGKVIERPTDPDLKKALADDVEKFKKEIDDIKAKAEKREDKNITSEEQTKIAELQEKITARQEQLQEASDLVSADQGVLTVQQKENAADSASIQGDGLGRLAEHKEAVQEIEADTPVMEEIDPAEIETENLLIEEDLNSPEYQDILPDDMKQDIAATRVLDEKASKYEELSRAGAACLLRR
tara:strand:+ start:1881 stop:3602 length:1722 start_codon:yes stop_codon:yes gene_type:complete